MLLLSGIAAGQNATQILDRVNIVSPRAVLDMAFDDPAQLNPFEIPPAITSLAPATTPLLGFTACQLTSTKGLVCLDQNNGNPGRWVRKWDPVSASGETIKPYLFSCEDPALGLDTSRGTESCTGISADLKGNVVVAGKRKGGYNLLKVTPASELPGSACDGSIWRPLASGSASSPPLCYKVLLPKDRPLVVDITYETLALPAATVGSTLSCTGVVGLEERKTLMFFKDPDAVPNDTNCPSELVIADSKAWGLQTKEVLQGATVLRYPGSGGTFVLVVSNLGRLWGKRTDVAGAPAFAVTLSRKDGTTPYASMTNLRSTRTGSYSRTGLPPSVCDSVSPQQFGIRTSTKSGRLYVTDRSFCEVSALQPRGSTLDSTALNGLQMVTFPENSLFDLMLATQIYSGTNYPTATQYPPLEPTLAPGISVDLSKCAGGTGCTLTADGSGAPSATLSQVTLASAAKGMTLFQIQNIPDCRWLKADEGKPGVPAVPSICNVDGVIVGNSDSLAGAQFLDVSKLLPKEVTDQFAPGALKPMYLSPDYRAQVRGIPAGVPVQDPLGGPPVAPRYYFDAFFGITNKDVVFADTFDLEVFVEDVSGSGKKLGCTASYPSSSWPVDISKLLQWDLIVRISEKDKAVGGPPAGSIFGGGPLSLADMLTNFDCGSSKGAGGSWSMFAFNLEVTDDAPSTFAKQTVGLFYDLYDALNLTACQAVTRADGSSLPRALDTTACSTLYGYWESARDKLDKCLIAANAPKQSEAVRNCQAFNSQLDNFEAAARLVPPCQVNSSCTDVANRRGELLARTATLRHLFNDRFRRTASRMSPTTTCTRCRSVRRPPD
jgi:hypothetical protein